jgi:CheY-like chemotaxis protein
VQIGSATNSPTSFRSQRRCCYVVVEGGNGAEALDMLAARPVCLALVDYAMPMMSGSEFVRLARRTRPDLPVIYVTDVRIRWRYESKHVIRSS